MADNDHQHNDPPEELPEASLMSHLLELRSRLLKAVGAVLGGFPVPAALHPAGLRGRGPAADVPAAQGLDDDRHGSGIAICHAFQGELLRRHPAGHPHRHLPDLGLRGPGTVPAREAPGGAVADFQRGALLRGRGFCLLGDLSHHVRLLCYRSARGCAGDDRHQQLHGFRTGAVRRLRRGLRGAGGHGPAGADRHGADRNA